MTVVTAAAEPRPTIADHTTLLPGDEPVRILGTDQASTIDSGLVRGLYRQLVLGRRFNRQVTALTKQGRLAVYPSTTGQEACQVGAAAVLGPQDWLFPTYRDTLSVVLRGVDPVETLTLLRGDWHTGYDSRVHRVAPLCTPLATHCPHAVGLAHAARLRGDDVVTLALVGDGATSEGDFHEALNFAAVYQSPTVFFVQNNRYAISVPLSKQTAAPSLAHKGIGYGIPGVLVDGNDVLAVHTVLTEAMERARAGGGPTLVEALTYRIDAHTNADDATRYRTDDEVAFWQERDPVTLLERHLRETGMLDSDTERRARDAAEEMAADLRTRLGVDATPDPMDLFRHVYAEQTPQLREQQTRLAAELAAESELAGGGQ
ncbi:pyruvate dehydrogenase E1 component subunit alpha [Longimycelium tulufanense]|uniref:Pyruvate dehydrogenase E1 component subunit alpha n=1 Tax=Longimycelium tulufanense TaxID=907463 RepID=A0A8J3FU81_9PSEU|nr:pyruvate dehydrogenase (acetyl-transferring) E1 component subunit alpha [Longimycelium tulufanense]GGM52910.1 pyruvate dehydrogenase E1 component subunit alpha [Longimycelium tulufanense]